MGEEGEDDGAGGGGDGGGGGFAGCWWRCREEKVVTMVDMLWCLVGGLRKMVGVSKIFNVIMCRDFFSKFT